jgi:elongator complex protein 1
MNALVNEIEASLMEAKDYNSAAIINMDYHHNVEAAARLFCKGYFFSDAIRILSLNKRSDLLSTTVDDGLAEGFGTMTVLLVECKNQINAQVPRIRELRIKKKEEPSFYYDGEVNDGADIPDNVSLAPTDASTTGGTLFTRYTDRTGTIGTIGTNATRKTSKHKKREERKRARGKKGTVYEEEYLVNSIGRLIERVNSVGEEVERLINGLMRRGMRERAIALQEAMIELVELCKGCVGEVFLKITGSEQNKEGTAAEVNRPSGGDGVLWDSLETSQWREAPVIKDFGPLSLLPRR